MASMSGQDMYHPPARSRHERYARKKGSRLFGVVSRSAFALRKLGRCRDLESHMNAKELALSLIGKSDAEILRHAWKYARDIERELAACWVELERETDRANQWVKSARDLARRLGLPDDESKASTHDWRFIESRLASREGSEQEEILPYVRCASCKVLCVPRPDGTCPRCNGNPIAAPDREAEGLARAVDAAKSVESWMGRHEGGELFDEARFVRETLEAAAALRSRSPQQKGGG